MNYYLLAHEDVLKLHMLQQDELWFFHAGGSLRLHLFDLVTRQYRVVDIGPDFEQGQFLQFAVPHNVWFGAEVVVGSEGGAEFSLCSCVLSPAWDLPDSTIPSAEQQAELLSVFPHDEDTLQRLFNKE
jgi:uncharacterized protein